MNRHSNHRGHWSSGAAATQHVPFEEVFAPFNAIAESVVSGAQGAATIAKSVFEVIKQEYNVQRAMRELAALDDRALSDIGIHRCEIPHVARFGSVRRVYGRSS